jgi:pyruvate/2-oxoglutarate/acetoin dehydrogenase E1 component
MSNQGDVRKMSMVEALRAALERSMREDPAVFLIGEDIADAEGGGTFKVTEGLSTAFGTERVRTTPISEQAIVGAAIGAAIAGLRPVAEIMLMNFVTVAMDQIFNHAAKLRYMSGGVTGVPLTIRTATGVGAGTAAQHSDMLEGWFAHTPGLKVVMPSTPAEAYGLLLASIQDDDPCIFVEKKELYAGREVVDVRADPIPLGVARIARAGADITLIAYGGAVTECLRAADILASQGVDAEVVDLRTVSPWDKRTVMESVSRTKAAVVVHESVREFGPGAEIAASLHEELFETIRSPVRRVGASASPVPFAPTLEGAYLYTPETIVEAALSTF